MHVRSIVSLVSLVSLGLASASASAAPGRVLPTAQITVPDEITTPLVLRGRFQDARPLRTMDARDLTRAEAPDFVMHLGADHANLRVHVFGAEGEVVDGDARAYLDTGSRAGGTGVRGKYAAGDHVMWVQVPASAAGEFTVVIWDGDHTPLDPTARHGAPADAAPVHERYLSSYLPWFVTASCGAPTVGTARVAEQLFTSLPRGFFVFPRRPVSGSNAGGPSPKPGEPVLIMNAAPSMGGSDRQVTVLSADGVCYSAEQSGLDVTPPTKVALPKQRELRIVRGRDQPDRWADEDLMPLFDPAAAAAYRARKARVHVCYDAEWDKLDPDHRAGRYDVATIENGRVRKIEALTAKFDRIASAKCGAQKIWTERDKLEQQALVSLAKARAAGRTAIEAYLATLFGG